MKYRKVADLHPLPNNPRTIDKDGLARVVDSIKLNGFWEHRPMALEEQDGRLIVLDGNQRLKAVKRLKIKEVPTVLYSELSDDERTDLILRSNINNGEWDFGALQTDPAFGDVDFGFIGLDFPKEKKTASKTATLAPLTTPMMGTRAMIATMTMSQTMTERMEAMIKRLFIAPC